jgi:hypothetical protein
VHFADAPQHIDGGGSNGVGFTGWLVGGRNVILLLSLNKLINNYQLPYSGSGHLPHQPYLKMLDLCLTGGVGPWFRQVVSGVGLHGEPYVFQSLIIIGSRDIVKKVVGVRRSGKPHLPVAEFNVKAHID